MTSPVMTLNHMIWPSVASDTGWTDDLGWVHVRNKVVRVEFTAKKHHQPHYAQPRNEHL